ncbi:MAG TPA: flagellar protein FlaG [Sideroxyarcus sp.]|nr:flagellar protein FlaG [Sideroxyarcus sp.]
MNIENISNAGQPAVRGGSGSAPAVKVPDSGGRTAEAPAAKTAEQKPTPEQLGRTVADMNRAIKQRSSNLQFTIDSDTHRAVVKLLDGETGDVIRQYPTEQALAISRAIDKIQNGSLLNVTA